MTTITNILVGIVTFNRIDKLICTLGECRAMGFDQLVVVDNGSTDGTREFLQGQADITTILSERNEGGSGGFNRVMRYFFEQTSMNLVLLMDDDAYPKFTRERLVGFLTDHRALECTAYACRVVYPSGFLCEMNRPGKNVLAYHPFFQLTKDWHIDESFQETIVDWSSFVGLLLTREAIERVGVVSTQFFIYSDDVYYTLSISRNNGKILYCPQLTLVHDCKRTSRNLTHHTPLRLEKEIVNKIVLIREFSGFPRLYIILYITRQIWKNPRKSLSILRAARKGVFADLTIYRNQPVRPNPTQFVANSFTRI
jgi:rhamnopyranosyl-N-acetylglucosaminyl-diphospho-decaprenol beta-1,3/1,4-galactofuranosyltransferase